jgi:hypothetical protein
MNFIESRYRVLHPYKINTGPITLMLISVIQSTAEKPGGLEIKITQK